MATVRRLTAILAADVAGYSRLMEADEEGTHEQLKAHRRALVDPKITEHHGRIVKTTGDGMLVEFPSVVDAVHCAVEVQRGMVERNVDTPREQRIEFRVGINLGDVIAEGEDIFGDGVNIAARLEALAEPGGICISRVVRDQIRDKVPYPFEDMGERSVAVLVSSRWPDEIAHWTDRSGTDDPHGRTTLRRLVDFDPQPLSPEIQALKAILERNTVKTTRPMHEYRHSDTIDRRTTPSSIPTTSRTAPGSFLAAC